MRAPSGQALKLIKRYLKCGLVGWCMEIIFTALNSLRRRDLRLMGSTSLWMFPIYGSAAFLAPVSRFLSKKPLWLRGLAYMTLFFSTEYLTGRLLQKRRLCPWDYRRSRWNVRQLIRLDYAPLWFAAGLLFERLLAAPPSSSSPDTTSSRGQQNALR